MEQEALRRSKIVATIGPASQAPEQLEALIEAGIDVARLNFSHGTYADHKAVIAHIRRLAREWGRPVAILQDLQGPKIRVGSLAAGAVDLVVPSLTAKDRADLQFGIEPGDSLVVLAGTPPTRTGATNMMKLHRAGDFV